MFNLLVGDLSASRTGCQPNSSRFNPTVCSGFRIEGSASDSCQLNVVDTGVSGKHRILTSMQKP